MCDLRVSDAWWDPLAWRGARDRSQQQKTLKPPKARNKDANPGERGWSNCCSYMHHLSGHVPRKDQLGFARFGRLSAHVSCPSRGAVVHM